MSGYKRGDLRIMRVTEIDGGRATLVDEGEPPFRCCPNCGAKVVV